MNRCAESDPPHDPTVTTFGVIRHAETVWNREKRIQGHQDSPLTPEGEMMADRWGLTLRVFHWDRILASDTGRATATARRINTRLQLPMELDPRLRELDWGRWTTKTLAQLRQEEGDLLAIQERAGWDFQPPQGESRRGQLALPPVAAGVRHPGRGGVGLHGLRRLRGHLPGGQRADARHPRDPAPPGADGECLPRAAADRLPRHGAHGQPVRAPIAGCWRCAAGSAPPWCRRRKSGHTWWRDVAR